MSNLALILGHRQTWSPVETVFITPDNVRRYMTQVTWFIGNRLSLFLYIRQFLRSANPSKISQWYLSNRPPITMLRSVKPHFIWESHSNGTAIYGKQELHFRSYKAWLVTFQMTSTFAPWRSTGLQRRMHNFCSIPTYFVCVCVWLSKRFNAC